MLIGIPKETREGERLVAATPKTVTQLRKLGHEVVVQTGAGLGASFTDAVYEAAGASIGDAPTVWGADLVAAVNPPSDAEVAALSEGGTLVAMLSPHSRGDLVTLLSARKVTALALDAASTAANANFT